MIENSPLNCLEHALIALVVQAAIGLLTGNWWAGAALSAGVFIGREHAQAEYMKDDVFLARYRKH